MQNELRIEIDRGQTEFLPAAKLRGTAYWSLHEPADKIEIRLFWYTTGKGDQDIEIAAKHEVSAPGQHGQKDFSFDLPEYPYSFSGKLISLIWALELVALPGEDSARTGIILSPTGREISLYG